LSGPGYRLESVPHLHVLVLENVRPRSLETPRRYPLPSIGLPPADSLLGSGTGGLTILLFGNRSGGVRVDQIRSTMAQRVLVIEATPSYAPVVFFFLHGAVSCWFSLFMESLRTNPPKAFQEAPTLERAARRLRLLETEGIRIHLFHGLEVFPHFVFDKTASAPHYPHHGDGRPS